MRRSRKLIGIVAGVGVLALALGCGVFALLPPGAPVALPPQAEVQQRAVQFAKDEYAGTVTNVAARATTIGQINPQRCSIWEHTRQRLAMLQSPEQQHWCNDNLPIWEVTMQGEFRNWEGNLVRTLQVTFGPDGNVSMVDAGP